MPHRRTLDLRCPGLRQFVLRHLPSVAAVAATAAAILLQPLAAAAQQPLCPERYHVAVDGHRLSLPYCSNMPTDVRNDDVDRIVFSVHGIGTNAVEYFEWMVAAAERVPGQTSRTLIIGPQLMTAANARAMGIGPTDVYWQSSSDRYWGPLSASIPEHPRAAAISVFELMDRWLADLVRPELFPNLRTVVIAGHSGGGQFTNRYAVASTFDIEAVRPGLRMVYVVANPSTYVYLTGERLVPGTTSTFALPASDAVAACPNYDHYGTGLQEKDAVPYLAALDADRMRRQYAAREVVYLLGEADNDPEGASLARGCNAMLQGTQRLERGVTYFSKMRHVFGPSIEARHRLVTVPDVAHEAWRMWASDEGVRVLFDAEPQR
jgi:hypothetical protein